MEDNKAHTSLTHGAPLVPKLVTGRGVNMIKGRGDSQFSCLYVLGRALDGVTVLGGELGDELQQGGALVIYRFTVAAEQGLVLGRQHIDPCFQLRQTVSDVVH